MDNSDEKSVLIKDFFNEVSIEEIILNLPGHAYWKDKNGFFLGCNDLQAKDLGLNSPLDIIGKTDFDLVSFDKATILRENDVKVMESGIPITIEEFNFISRKTPLHNKKGEIIGILGVSIDITEFKELITIENKIFDEIIGLMPGHVYWKDKNCVLLGCNLNQAKDVGLSSRAEIVGKTAYDLIYPFQSEEDKRTQAAITDAIDIEIMQKNESQTVEEFVVGINDQIKYYLSQKTPLHDKSGNVIGLVGVSVDITERKETEEELRKAKEFMQLISASIAHELRTPLAAIKSSLFGLEMFLPKLMEGYELAQQHELPVPKINQQNLLILNEAISSIGKKVDHSNMVIDMLLTNLAHNRISSQGFVKYSIKDCVNHAIEKYIFVGDQKKLVKVNIEQDFYFLGKKELIIHVFFNMFKNALYFI